MASPIRKTPTLTGKQASKFIEMMIKTQKRKVLNSKEKELLSLMSTC